MKIYDYVTSGGKNLILEYIFSLKDAEQLRILDIRSEIEKNGLDAFEKLDTRQLRKKLWEIRCSQNRIMYVIRDTDTVFFLHACKKEKSKAERKDIDIAISRAKTAGLI